MSAITAKFRALALSPTGDIHERWRRWLPRTMAGLVAAGCLLAAAPLLVTVLLASVALERLTVHTHQLVEEGLTVARLGAELSDRVNDLERSARQYAALGDPQLLAVFDNRLQLTQAALDRIDQFDLRAAFTRELARARQGLTEASEAWVTGLRDGGPMDPAVELIHSLTAEADAIVASGRAAIDGEVEQLRQANEAARRLILFTSLLLIPLTALLAYGFSLAVTRPLRRLGGGIVALGHAQYRDPIEIGYPREMQQLGERLDWLRRRLAQLEADKDGFLRHVSHELKTPLASLREGATLLHEGALGPLTDSQAEVAQILAESASELDGQIQNLLAYAEWREERRQSEISWFQTQPFVDEVLGAHKLTMTRRGLRVELDLRCARLFGQRSRLRVVLDNLMTNAVKHAPQDSAITIRASVHEGCCELSVRDRGRGVSAADKDRIFEPFVRGTELEESTVRGTGVGLSIVKETALAHEGIVEVADAAPGARFKLLWPCPEESHA